MAINTTIEARESVAGFLTTIKEEKKRKDFSKIIDLITEHAAHEPKMWGTGIVGFRMYHYKYESGREGTAPLAAIASKANAITLYLSANFDNREELLPKFGKYKTGRGCIYIKKLEDIDTGILAKMVKNSIEHKMKLYPG